MDRLERLVNLVAALIDADRPLTREELRDRVGGYTGDAAAFRRTFERDKDTLREMGLPLEVEPVGVPGGDDQFGYRIPRDAYELPDPGLTEEELAALRIAAGAVNLEGALGADAPERALRKLAAPAAAAGGLAGTAALAGGTAVPVTFGAVAEQRRLRFRYRGEERLVDPWRLTYRSGAWYLSGWDHARAAERQYRLDRVDGEVSAEGPPGAFEVPEGGSAGPPPPWRLGEGPATQVRVLVDADQLAWAAAAAGPDAVVERRPDGSGVLELAVTNREGLRSWVLGFLEHAEVLDPPEVRAELVGWLERLA